jgi:spermidine synthase
VFPGGTVWANPYKGKGYDVFLLGQNGPTSIDLDRIQRRLDSLSYAGVGQSLRDAGFTSAAELFSMYAGEDADLRPWLRDAQINRDSNLRLQYLAGLALNDVRSDGIYQNIMRYRRVPAFLTGSAARVDSVVRQVGVRGDGR